MKILTTATAPVIGYLLVETNNDSGDWQARIEREIDLFARLDRYIVSNPDIELRLQAVRKSHPPHQKHRVIIYLRGRLLNGPLTRYEYLIPENKLYGGIVELFERDMNSPYAVESPTTREILVCSHEQRDQCCGRFGYDLYQAIADQPPPGTEVWMSSHIGGHRMAPTIVDLPYARYWGHVTKDFVKKLVEYQDLSRIEIDAHYRGFIGIPRVIQVAEREGIFHQQWKWLKTPFSYKMTKSGFSITSSGGDEIVGTISEYDRIYVGQTACADLKSVLIPKIAITAVKFGS